MFSYEPSYFSYLLKTRNTSSDYMHYSFENFFTFNSINQIDPFLEYFGQMVQYEGKYNKKSNNSSNDMLTKLKSYYQNNLDIQSGIMNTMNLVDPKVFYIICHGFSQIPNFSFNEQWKNIQYKVIKVNKIANHVNSSQPSYSKLQEYCKYLVKFDQDKTVLTINLHSTSDVSANWISQNLTYIFRYFLKDFEHISNPDYKNIKKYNFITGCGNGSTFNFSENQVALFQYALDHKLVPIIDADNHGILSIYYPK